MPRQDRTWIDPLSDATRDDQPLMILGGPGTGKTTACVDLVVEALNDGLVRDLERVCYVSFTRQAARRARAVVADATGASEEDIPYFQTLHAFAFHQLGLRPGDIMPDAAYREIAAECGIQIGDPSGSYLDPFSLRPWTPAQERGNAVVQAEAYARARGIPVEDAAHLRGVDHATVEVWSRALGAYKRESGHLDFSDIIQRCAEQPGFPAFDLVVQDEAQDASPLLWSLWDRLAAMSTHRVLAGDDDQAIYAWAGADVDRFLDARAHRIVLPVSHRLRARVFEVADRVARSIGRRYEKNWRPRDDGGVVARHLRPSELDIGDGRSWLLLARTRALLQPFVRWAYQLGLAYSLHGRSSLDRPAGRAAQTWERLRSGLRVDLKEAREMARFLGRQDLTDSTLASLEERETVSMEDLVVDCGLIVSGSWHDVLEMPEPYRAYLRRVETRQRLDEPPRVSIRTIHESKGAEAECVALSTKLTRRTQRSYEIDPDAERRVLYVGVSRALEELHLVVPPAGPQFREVRL